MSSYRLLVVPVRIPDPGHIAICHIGKALPDSIDVKSTQCAVWRVAAGL